MLKKCSSCKQEKPAAEYNKNSQARDGLSFYCKTCVKARNDAYTKKQIERRKKIAPAKSKVCNICGLVKTAATEYHKSSRNKDGLMNTCKLCVSLYQRLGGSKQKEVVKLMRGTETTYRNILVDMVYRELVTDTDFWDTRFQHPLITADEFRKHINLNMPTIPNDIIKEAYTNACGGLCNSLVGSAIAAYNELQDAIQLFLTTDEITNITLVIGKNDDAYELEWCAVTLNALSDALLAIIQETLS